MREPVPPETRTSAPCACWPPVKRRWRRGEAASGPGPARTDRSRPALGQTPATARTLLWLTADIEPCHIESGTPNELDAPAVCLDAAGRAPHRQRPHRWHGRHRSSRSCTQALTAEHLITGTTPVGDIAKAIQERSPADGPEAEVTTSRCSRASPRWTPPGCTASDALPEAVRGNGRRVLDPTWQRLRVPASSSSASLQRFSKLHIGGKQVEEPGRCSGERRRRGLGDGALRELDTILYSQSMAGDHLGELAAADRS